ncbi:hypothetical protein GOP47_0019970 [Adiantum capillus-veneris]|uniref:Uncharacterized protein n=1 Tax=Adiantum capillus-veneris TaxID=13818 RepID=A0A9D4Z8Z2_ADICA|nr:hypothetical protein GOP47_0019970 [Adiantum capillus-veneris]
MAASLTLLTMCLLMGSYYMLSMPLVSGGYYVGKPLKRRPPTKPRPSSKSHTKHYKKPHIKPPSTRRPAPRKAYPTDGSGWLPATATWYGSATGSGTDGGACGYGSLDSSPYGKVVSAGSPVLFKAGMGCGACYQVKCLAGAICSPRPATVVITDECPGGYCASGKTHFDMSGAAFGAMASSTQSTQSLLNAGVVQVLYRRVPCSYKSGTMVSFQVNQGATNYWFSVLIRYVRGDGEISAVELMEGGQWRQMEHLWGAYWCLNSGPLQAPFSVKVTSSRGASLTALNVIPANWAPGQTYASNVNF